MGEEYGKENIILDIQGKNVSYNIGGEYIIFKVRDNKY